MRPILEHPSLACRPPGRVLQQAAIVRAEPEKGGEIVRPRQDIDAVDLEEAKPIDGLPDMRDGRLIDRALAKALRRESNPARVFQGKSDGHHLGLPVAERMRQYHRPIQT